MFKPGFENPKAYFISRQIRPLIASN